jgi:hypothetical protein
MKNHAAPIKAKPVSALTTRPAIAPPEIDEGAFGSTGDEGLSVDRSGADGAGVDEVVTAVVEECKTDVVLVSIPKKVWARVSTPMSPAQQSLLSPQHHRVELAVSSHGIILTLRLA